MKIIMCKFNFKPTTIFWVLIVVFAIIIGNMILLPSFLPESLRVYVIYTIFTSWAISFVLGLALIASTVKQKVEGALKKFLLLTGASAVAFPVFAVLHNLIYGLFIYFFGQDFWERIGLGDEPFFFILAVIVCPIGFLVGMIGSIVLFIKKGRQA